MSFPTTLMALSVLVPTIVSGVVFESAAIATSCFDDGLDSFGICILSSVVLGLVASLSFPFASLHLRGLGSSRTFSHFFVGPFGNFPGKDKVLYVFGGRLLNFQEFLAQFSICTSTQIFEQEQIFVVDANNVSLLKHLSELDQVVTHGLSLILFRSEKG